MTNAPVEFVSESMETNVHQRKKKKKKKSPDSPVLEPSESQRSLVQWFASYIPRRSSKKKVETVMSNDDQKEKKQYESKKNSCCCCAQGVCVKLILFLCAIYLILFFRPDYSIAIRNTVENVLKKFNLTSEEFRQRPGQRLAHYRQPSMPIIIIPGIISTGLELWRGAECAEGKFRHRFWTSMQMVDSIGRDHQCWLKHISLNLSTW